MLVHFRALLSVICPSSAVNEVSGKYTYLRISTSATAVKMLPLVYFLLALLRFLIVNCFSGKTDAVRLKGLVVC